MKIEVLVATMHQKDFSLVEKMNLQTDAVIANQDDRYEYTKLNNEKNIKMITTSDRGIGKNRNKALLNAEGDICLFADDDLVYDEGYEKIVESAFEKLPNADIIIFNIDTVGEVTRSRRSNNSIKRVHLINALNYGTHRIAVKRDSILKKNIWFSLLFGASVYGSGEDSLFLASALKNKLKIYTYPKRLATISQAESSWFNGYTDKYFKDKGAFYCCLSKRYSKLLCIQDALRHKGMYKRPFSECFVLMKKGIKEFCNK